MMSEPTDLSHDAEEFLETHMAFTPEQWNAYCQGLDAEYEKCYRCALFASYQGPQGSFDECKLFGTPEPLLCHYGPYISEASRTKVG